MRISYKEGDANQTHTRNSILELNPIVIPEGGMNLGFFRTIYSNYFMSNLDSNITSGIDLIIRYAKEKEYSLFLDFGMNTINQDMIDLANSEEHDFFADILKFYKYMTRCSDEELEIFLTNELLDFFNECYVQPKNNECRPYIYHIYLNIFSKNRSLFSEYINKNMHFDLIDSFWAFLSRSEDSDDDARIVAAIFQFFTVFYMNFQIVQNQDYDFFKNCKIAYISCFEEANRIILPAAVKSFRISTDFENQEIISGFYSDRYFPLYFNLLTYNDTKVRYNMIAALLSFTQLATEDLMKIINFGLFNLEIPYDLMHEDEMIQFLNVMYRYVLKDIEIAEKIAFSRILFDVNKFGHVLTFQIKEIYFSILAQLIRTDQYHIIKNTFSLCPLFIEITSDFLPATSNRTKINILLSYRSLLNFVQSFPNYEEANFISGKLYSNEMIDSVNQIFADEVSYENTKAIASSLLKDLSPNETDI